MKKLASVFILVSALVLVGVVYADRTVVTQSTASIATTSTQAVAAVTTGKQRRLLVLINDSDTAIYCNLAGGAAVANEGVRLNASGGSIFMDVAVTYSAVNCIHAGTGTKTLLVAEGN